MTVRSGAFPIMSHLAMAGGMYLNADYKAADDSTSASLACFLNKPDQDRDSLINEQISTAGVEVAAIPAKRIIQ